MYFLILIIAITSMLVSGQKDKFETCQDVAKVSGCACDFQLFADCKKIGGSLEKLKEILDVTRGNSVKLALRDINVEKFPSDLFQGQAIEYLIIKNFSIGSFGEKPFAGLEESLETLLLWEFTILFGGQPTKDPFSGFTISHLKKLKRFEIVAKNNLLEIPDSWFNGGDSLKTLSYYYNAIKSIGDHAFSSLGSLETLNLEFNQIQNIKRSMFPKPANYLREIEISGNQITNLPSDIFSDMPNLKKLDFNDNQVHTLDQATWEIPFNNLVEIYVVGNPIQCDASLSWMNDLNAAQRELLHGKCETPQSLKGKNIKDLDFSSLANTN